jgi:hypothetical protein
MPDDAAPAENAVYNSIRATLAAPGKRFIRPSTLPWWRRIGT